MSKLTEVIIYLKTTQVSILKKKQHICLQILQQNQQLQTNGIKS